eukprot:TRINITY_DN11546_c0_g1_i2.p1 TRINITY_DN11546_c0_g1~~TRINITY_DN11546_c0_g1_i2.p1  ORF type:complete len:473 (+),score=76.97 TRINITY_DN11546_c0_g1_i2:63-1481(+)
MCIRDRHTLSGLRCLKGVGIIHFDIKPRNLILSNGLVKIIDFGSSMPYRHDNLEEGRLLINYRGQGTRGYIAPELINSDNVKVIPHAIDLYSLGVTLLKLGQRARDLHSEEIEDVLQLFHEVYPNLHESVRNLLSKTPEERVAVYQEYINELDDCGRHQLLITEVEKSEIEESIHAYNPLRTNNLDVDDELRSDILKNLEILEKEKDHLKKIMTVRKMLSHAYFPQAEQEIKSGFMKVMTELVGEKRTTMARDTQRFLDEYWERSLPEYAKEGKCFVSFLYYASRVFELIKEVSLAQEALEIMLVVDAATNRESVARALQIHRKRLFFERQRNWVQAIKAQHEIIAVLKKYKGEDAQVGHETLILADLYMERNDYVKAFQTLIQAHRIHMANREGKNEYATHFLNYDDKINFVKKMLDTLKQLNALSLHCRASHGSLYFLVKNGMYKRGICAQVTSAIWVLSTHLILNECEF